MTVSNAFPVADKVNSNYFYIHDLSAGKMYVSSNSGTSFTASGTPGASSAPWTQTYIRAVPGYEGHLWVPLIDNGLKYSTDHGATFTKISNVASCSAVGIGKADASATYPTVFIWGTVGGVNGLFRSTNKGASWTRVNDNAHQFGGTTLVFGDMNVFGRVYMSGILGRGLIYWNLDSPNAIETKSTLNEMVIYPNPTQAGKFSIEIPMTSPKATLHIFDNQGRMLFEKVIRNYKGKLTIDAGLNKGIYLVKVTSDGLNFGQKLIVQ